VLKDKASTPRSFLIISGVQGDTRRYRTFHLHQQLLLLGADSTLSHLTDSALPGYINRADVIFLHRVAQDRYVEKMMTIARRRGALLLMDTDDLIFDLEAFDWIDSPDFRDSIRRKQYLEEMSRQRDTLLSCDAALTSTSFLATRIKQTGIESWVHRNAFSLEMLAASEAAVVSGKHPVDQIVIGFASGTLTHNRDFDSISPLLMASLEAHPQVKLMIVGHLELELEWHSFKDQILHQRFINWRELPCVLAGFDINLAPLVIDNPFSQSKSEIKFMEAGLVRVPTIASTSPAFAGAIQNGEDGYLASRQEEWQAALENLIDSRELARQMGESAYHKVMSEYHPLVRAQELKNTLDEIGIAIRGAPIWPTGYVMEQPDLSMHMYWISPEKERHPNLLDRAVYSLRHRGILTLVSQIWIYVRRLVSPIIPYPNPR
jgi:glycosyltransferase involved in cell wall biosynthesis